jgi:hypothetical protein
MIIFGPIHPGLWPVLLVHCASFALFAFFAGVAVAQTTLPTESEEIPPKVETRADVEGEAHQPVESLLDPDPIEPPLEAIGIRSAQRWAEERKIHPHLGFTFVWQGATDVEEDTNNLTTGSFDLSLTWEIFDTGQLSGSLGFLADGGQVIGHHQSEDLSANVGSAMGINADYDTEFARVAELWYAQGFGADDTVVVTVGKIDQTAYFDTNRIANDETTQFLSSPLVNNLSVPFPDRGLGINAAVKLSEQLYATIGYGDAAANANENGFNTVDNGDWFTAAEVGFAPTFGGDGDDARTAAYRLTVWGSGLDDGGDGMGVALSADHEIVRGIVPFARLGFGDDAVTAFEYFASAGVGFEDAFGRAGHMFAIGAAWARTGGSDKKSETIVEAFYRLPLTDTISLSPDVQFVFDPIDSDGGVVLVGGIRVQASF